MSDTHLVPDDLYEEWHSDLRCGDVIAFRFPAAYDAPQRPAKVQPCILLDVTHVDNDTYVTIALGTDIRPVPQRPQDIRVEETGALFDAGLSAPTNFDCNHRITVSIKHQGFDLTVCGSPLLGRLSGDDLDRFNSIRTEVRARADRASAHWAAKRRQDMVRSQPDAKHEISVPAPYSLEQFSSNGPRPIY